MDELPIQTEITTPPKTNGWTARSFYYGILAIGLLIIPLLSMFLTRNQIGGLALISFIFLLMSSFAPFIGFIAIISGILGLVQTRKGDAKAIMGISLGLLCILIVIGSDIVATHNHSFHHPKWTDKSNWEKLEKGMTKEQVERILGKPKQIVPRGDRWYYQETAREIHKDPTFGYVRFFHYDNLSHAKLADWQVIDWVEPDWSKVQNASQK